MADHDFDGRVASRPITPDIANTTTAARSAVDRDPIDSVACRLGDGSCANAHASAIDRSHRIDRSSTHDALLRLQRSYGNRYVGQVLELARDGESGQGGLDGIERSIDQARGGGQGLDHRTRGQMESAFGADFSGVRIHTDSHADGLSHALSARAFATGKDVFFRQGEYDPGSSGGRELLAHELTHVVQQTGHGILRKMTVSQPNDPHEVEADQMARAVVQQEHSQSIDRQMIAREKDEEAPIAAMRAADSLQRQPEAPKPQDEDEKKKLHAKLDSAVVSRQEDEEAPGG